MVFSETIYVMLLTHDKYRQFTSKKIADAKATSQVLICLSAFLILLVSYFLISWTPTVCCVHPTAYANAPVRSRPEFAQSASATYVNSSIVQPQASATNSGV